MILDRIVTIASEEVRIDFYAMERSLRSTGCKVPISVIPFNDTRFSLPSNASWWEEPVTWTKKVASGLIRHPFQYRFYTLATGGFQMADCDLIFLRNPEDVLMHHNGLVTCCHQWHVPEFAAPSFTLARLRQYSTNWQARLFNAGQFALSEPLYELGELAEELLSVRSVEHTFANEPPWDQGGFNILAAIKNANMVNLCFPPYNMESTWAGDYTNGFSQFWSEPSRRPFLIHWAGAYLDYVLPINELFFSFLTAEEICEWKKRKVARLAKRNEERRNSLSLFNRGYEDFTALLNTRVPRFARLLKSLLRKTRTKH